MQALLNVENSGKTKCRGKNESLLEYLKHTADLPNLSHFFGDKTRSTVLWNLNIEFSLIALHKQPLNHESAFL